MGTDAAIRNLEEAASALRRIFPHGTLLRRGDVVGVWAVVSREGGAARICSVGRSDDGLPRATDAVVHAGDVPFSADHPPPFGPGSAANFGVTLRTLMGLSGDGRPGGRYEAALTVALVGEAGDLGLSAYVVTGAVRRHAREAAASVAAFASTLDPAAVATPRLGDEWVWDGASWEGVDPTFLGGAALRAARAARPHLAATLTSAWRDDRAVFRDAPDPSGVAYARLATRGVVTGWSRGSFDEAEAAYLALPPDVVEAMEARSLDLRPGLDLFVDRLLPLDGLPRDWRPRGPSEWDAWFRLVDVVRLAAQDVHDPDHLAAYLAARGRWREWAGRLAATAGVHDPGDAVGAVHDLWDVATAMSAQLLDTAVAIGEGPDPERVTDRVSDDVSRHAAFTLLYSGRTLRRCLEASASWHVREAMTSARLAAMWGDDPGGEAALGSDWGAGLPDHRIGGCLILVVTSRGGLADEGAPGLDACGVRGLSHCVSGRHGDCLAGRTRILSVRRVLPGGAQERMSTAEVGVDVEGFPLREHRARANAAPPPEAEAALEAYLGLLRSGMLPVDRPALRPRPEGRSLSARAGYPWHVPGRWEEVRDLWRPVLPGPLKGIGRDELARLAVRASDASPAGWLPRALAVDGAPS